MPYVLYVCFFLSGAAGLLYEIYWAQRLGLLLGLDVYSHAAVLTAFMGGLALGSHVAGRWADRLSRPWVAYAWLELGIGACGLLIPVMLSNLTAPMRWMYGITDGAVLPMTSFRFAVAVLLLLVPTSLMGATLPIMTVAMRRGKDRLGEVVGRLYALNTAGAVVGVLLGGFVLSEAVGLSGTNNSAIWLNVVAAGMALAVGWKTAPSIRGVPESRSDFAQPAEQPQRGQGEPWTAHSSGSWAVPMIAVGAGLTGAAAMITQIGWTRVVALCFGSSTYAFTLIVAVFLIGLALGASLATRLVRRWPDALVPWSWACVLTASLCWAVILPLGLSPVFAGQLLERIVHDSNWSIPAIYTALGGATFVLLGLPAVALGMTFPLACEAYALRRPVGTAQATGRIYAANTIGAMLGSAAGGLVFIGWFGIQGTLQVGAMLYLAAGIIGAVFARPRHRRRFLWSMGSVGAIAACSAYALAVPWNPETMISGPFLGQRDQLPLRILSYKEAPEGVVAVAEQVGDDFVNRFLIINGKPDANSTTDMPTQILSGQLPLLLHGHAQDVAIIGLGSGVTLHATLTHPVQRVDLIELSAAVIDAIRPPDGSPGPFDSVNGRALDDPRVNLIVADGRNHLTLTDRRYDVICSQPSNPWMAGVSYLFTREFFEACRSRLRDNGIFCQWIQSYHLPPREFFRVLRTVSDVFDNATLWLSPSLNDYLIIATDQPRGVVRQLSSLMQRPEIRGQLERLAIRSPSDLLGLYLLDSRDVEGVDWGGDTGSHSELALNTDDRNRLNYAAVRALWRPESTAEYALLFTHRSFPFSWTGALDRQVESDAALIARIEDAQDTLRLFGWYQNGGTPFFALALRDLGGPMYGLQHLARELPQLEALEQPDPAHRRTGNAFLDQARRELAASYAASDREEQILKARAARLFALVARAANPQSADAHKALAQAQRLMGRPAAHLGSRD